jgi:very-short-patch-repair endonuclease
MSRLFGIDALAEEVASAAEASTRARYQRMLNEYSWTPIEALFLAAFIAQTELSVYSTLPFTWAKAGKTNEQAEEDINDIGYGGLYVFPQCQFNDWRVDFLIGLNEPPKHRWLIVECDGHDFHERTKEQAAKDRSRDRAYQARGYGVFRFTGSELSREPLRKAGEAYSWLMQSYLG